MEFDYGLSLFCFFDFCKAFGNINILEMKPFVTTLKIVFFKVIDIMLQT